MSLLDKIKKNSTIKEVEILATSKYFTNKDMVQIPVPALNIALSGSLSGGLTPGLTQIVGESKHFKSTIMLIMAKAYLDKYKDAVILFYNNEFGAGPAMFESLGIDTNRVVHVPFMDLEQFTLDVMSQLDGIERGDKVIIIVDSLGQAASKKEAQDALDGKSKEDMSRPKKMKGMSRMITPYLNLKDVPMLAVNHVYSTQDLFSKKVVSGGQGLYLASDNIIMMGRQQEKEGTDVVGYKFVMNIEKGRYTKEKSKIPLTVSFDGGISTWSGLLDIALENGFVTKPSNGWYTRPKFDLDGKKYRERDTDTKDFWLPVLMDKAFQQAVEQKYKLFTGDKKLLHDDNMYETYADMNIEIDYETGEILGENDE